MAQKKLAISITLDSDMLAYIDAIAEFNSRSRSSMIAHIIREWAKYEVQEKELNELFSAESEV